MARCAKCGKEKREHVLLCPDVIDRRIEELQMLRDVAIAARSLMERIRELEGDVPDSALLTGAYGPELGRLIEALKAWEEANRDAN